MDCARFDRRLDALLEGSCSAAEWREAEAHAAACARCRLLLDAMAGLGGSQDAAGAESLADEVLARTSGATCGAARERLGDLVDGDLEGIDRELVEGHLARCRPCAELAAAMARASELLPAFAALQPPADLAPAVIAATSRRPPAPTFDERVAAWLSKLAARPRFSLEAAYLCTLLIFIIVGNPVAAFRETSARGRELAEPRVVEVLERVSSGPAGLVREIGEAVAGRAASARRGETGVASRAFALVSPAWEWVSTRVFGPLRDAFTSLVAWVSELRRPNPSTSGRVTETGRAKATDGSGRR
ncbi:MAG TPA: zf-HC2 domain-containing protein [Vicinamibacterales bacterium]|nr:zf-HC2 domain-containing protein [Acidobacteriota bacterium]HOC17148.1 zf-HC2 domain-containing protein [Vicinamibacterales bacterium]